MLLTFYPKTLKCCCTQ